MIKNTTEINDIDILIEVIQEMKLTSIQIIESVCDYFNISTDKVKGYSKGHEYKIPRDISYFIVYNTRAITCREVGVYFDSSHDRVREIVKIVYDKINYSDKYNMSEYIIMTLKYIILNS